MQTAIDVIATFKKTSIGSMRHMRSITVYTVCSIMHICYIVVHTICETGIIAIFQYKQSATMHIVYIPVLTRQ